MELTKFRVYFAGICSLIVTAGVARFSYSLLIPIMQDGSGSQSCELVLSCSLQSRFQFTLVLV